jgi:hypothetical protein
MKDKDVIKMLKNILGTSMDKSRGAPGYLQAFSNMRQPSKKRVAPTRKQLKALEEGRKILLMNRKQSQK